MTVVAGNARASPEEPQRTTYDVLVELLRDEFGTIPPTAWWNGEEVPAGQALALVAANAHPVPAEDATYPWDVDQGIGHVFGGFTFGYWECRFAVFAQRITITAGRDDPFRDRELAGVPNPADGGETGGSTALCAFAGKVSYVVGEAGAAVGPDPAVLSVACISVGPFGLGTWVQQGSGLPCSALPFTAMNAVGLVGHILLGFCFLGVCTNVGFVFGGIQNPLPSGPGGQLQNTLALIGLSSNPMGS